MIATRPRRGQPLGTAALLVPAVGGVLTGAAHLLIDTLGVVRHGRGGRAVDERWTSGGRTSRNAFLDVP